MQQIYHFTVRSENDDFFILVRVKEFQQVNQSVLGGNLHVELLNLVWNGDRKLVVAVSLLILKAYCFVLLHHFSAQHLHFLGQRRTNEVDSQHIRVEQVFLLCKFFRTSFFKVFHALGHFSFKTHV